MVEYTEKQNKIIKEYNIWSNFTYFLSGIYAISIGSLMKEIGKVYQAMFILFGLLLIITGSVSCVYHCYTPSYQNDTNQINKKEYEALSETDIYLALTCLIYSLVFFFIRLYAMKEKRKNILIDSTLYITILFGIISIIFFSIARTHDHTAINECKNNECFQENMDAYDIFHSNWHLFTGISAMFGITLLKHTFN